jgi:hypothetical protein
MSTIAAPKAQPVVAAKETALAKPVKSAVTAAIQTKTVTPKAAPVVTTKKTAAATPVKTATAAPVATKPASSILKSNGLRAHMTKPTKPSPYISPSTAPVLAIPTEMKASAK